MTPRATITAAKMIARVSERQSSNVSPHAHCRPLEISQMANAAIAARSSKASVNSYHRGDCTGAPAAPPAACGVCAERTSHAIRKASTPIMATTTMASTKIVALCSKDVLTFR